MTENNHTPADAPERSATDVTGESADEPSAFENAARAAKRVVSRVIPTDSDGGPGNADNRGSGDASPSNDASDQLDDETPLREQSLADVGPETDVPITFHTKYPTLAKTVPPILVDPPTMMRYRDGASRAKRREPVTTDEERSVPDGHYVIQAWCDILVKVDEEGGLSVETAGRSFDGQVISAANFGDLGQSVHYGDYFDEVVVLSCPWKVETPEHVGVTTMQAPGHHAEPFRVATTATNTAYVNDLPIVLAIEETDEESEIVIGKGDPLVAAWPFVRSRPSASVEVADEEFWHEYENSYPQVSINLDDFETYVEKDPLLDTAAHQDLLTNDVTTDE